jgi:hypothetical protein
VVGAVVGAAVSRLAVAGASATSSLGLPPRPPTPAPTTFPKFLSGTAGIVLWQNFGDPATVFLIHGEHWKPFTHVTIEVVGVGTSSIHPTIDAGGTFNYAINQDHDIFRGPIPPGTYHVVVTGTPFTGTGTRRVQATFLINPPPKNGPPPFPGAPPISPLVRVRASQSPSPSTLPL